MTLGSGGVEAMIASLSNEMSKNNQVDILTIFAPKESDLFIKRLDSRVGFHTLGKVTTGISLRYIWKMYRFIRYGNYDVVNIHGFFYYHFLSVLLNHNRTKYFYTVHSDAVKENNNWDRYLFKLKRFCFKKMWMRPITISETSRVSFERLYKCSSILIHNGVENRRTSDLIIPEIIKLIRINKDTKVFLHAGRISEPKNQLVLCEAFSQIINEGTDVALIIAGPNQDQSIFDSLKPFFSNPRIHYIGERNDIINLLCYSDAMLLPSLWEGLPVILLESLSVGCVPICSPVGGIVDVIHDGYNGILTKDSTKESIIKSVRDFLAFKENKLSVMRKNALSSFETYDIANTSKEYLYAYTNK